MSRHDRGLYKVLIMEALAASLRQLGEPFEARSTELRDPKSLDDGLADVVVGEETKPGHYRPDRRFRNSARSRSIC
jgi:hypothetical protein